MNLEKALKFLYHHNWSDFDIDQFMSDLNLINAELCDYGQ